MEVFYIIKINNRSTIEAFKDLHNIDSYFSSDMTTHMEIHIFEKGELVYRSNEEIEYFYFLVKGKCKVYTLLQNGKSLLLRFYNPLMVMGDLEFISESTANCNVEAVHSCTFIGISLDVIRKYAKDDAIFLRHICKSLSEKLATSAVSNSINLLYPLENRLASYMLAISSEEDLSTSLKGIVAERFTEIAELLGTSYRHLLRIINKLCDQKIIARNGNSLVILDYERLENLAGDLYQ
ncbi:cyclic nucleotide-binding domain-containing protein [Clostridium folliculivorans]|nr:cyclic nucleotide-binding domain-containing protein [Clostridium folliculivorans]